MSEENRTRRAVLGGAGAIGVAGVAALVAGCEAYGDTDAAPTQSAQQPAPGTSTGGATTAPAAGKELAKTTDIPVGGGKIFESDDIVVTQPEANVFKAFSATCTHQGCLVSSVEGGTINCACHGSKFKIADGTVANGPAAKKLGSARITVEGDKIIKG
ncbi:Rieske Fe-S protein [Allocatelliglobosispora scoriae]|uniref:Cytochrome bc1 complex Rieske iron-sulfur subunit n=1 Tax=Allocatelliglobosispora scoriae TaxID=643052 RepID=A0A841BKI2_9ACTN|nr:Rieske (2Fe-2S) protein [Allocatelliglobosispora scoriae]MBB5869607.1 Rieske Fe-S protein [Allocatelliglobosispora scoriae]